MKSIKLISDDADDLDKISEVAGTGRAPERIRQMIDDTYMVTEFGSSCSSLHPHLMLPNWKQYLSYYCISQLG